jgi:hypothetical protein
LGKAPEPTDPKDTSAASTGTNVSTAIANNIMGNINENTPDGSTTVTQSGEYTWTDPYTDKTYTVPKFTRDTVLSDMGQQIKGETDQTKLGLAELANSQTQFLQDYLSKPFEGMGEFSYDEGKHEKWATGLYDKLNNRREADQSEELRSQLANSGIGAGSDAYYKATESQGRVNEDARNKFMLDSYNSGFGNNLNAYTTNFQTQQATRNQPINEISALMSGSQVAQPQFQGMQFNRIPTTDNAGIIANYDQQKLAGWQAQMGMLGNIAGGLFSMGGSMLSDRRLKKDVKTVGKVSVTSEKTGRSMEIPKVKWNYLWEKDGKPRHEGVMAQDLEKVKPSAVMTLGGGIKAVDYSQVH